MRVLGVRMAVLVIAGILMAGCPLLRPPKDTTYTSADLFNGGRAEGPALYEADDLAGDGGAEAERAVEEPDVYRREGSLLYILNQYRGLTLVDLDSLEVLSRVPTMGYPRDLYLRDGRAYVLTANAADYTTDGDTISFDIASRLHVVDVSNPAEPTLQSQLDLPGDIVDSRLVGDVLYAVSAEYQYGIYEDAVVKQQSGASWVTSVNIANPNAPAEADQLQFDGTGTIIHATSTAIFVAAPNWSDSTTGITYIDISDATGALAQRGGISIPGQVADRFKLDVYDGVLRVVSQTWAPDGRKVLVTTIDLADHDTLTQLAQLELEDAANETLFATRFDGPRAYIVTYFIVDPLFVVDLADPSNPQLMGELEVPGWSTHIEPYGDRLLAMGVDDTDGRRISVSLFDVSGPPQRLDIVTFGENWAWSNAYNDVKAFAILDDLIVVPFSGWNNELGGYDRLQLISWNNSGLQLEGTVDINGQGIRTTSYNGLYYGLSQEEVAVIDAGVRSAPSVVDRVALADDVADLIPLPGGNFAEIIRDYDAGDTKVRIVTETGEVFGEIAAEIGYFREAHLYGDDVILVGAQGYGYGPVPVFKGQGGYTVAYVDCSDSASPDVVYTTNVDVQPYYGFYGWYVPYYDIGIGIEPALDKQFAADLIWWPFTNTQISYVVDGSLALRCHNSAYDAVLGDAEPGEGLALVDLGTGEHTSTLGLGLEFVVSLDQSGDRLYAGAREEIEGSLDVRPLCAYYLAEIDVAAQTMGPLVNVPGTFVRYDRDDDVLVLRDQQWSGIANVENTLRSVSWNGVDDVEPIDAVPLPDSAYRIFGNSDTLFGEAYNNGYSIFAITVGDDGDLRRGDTIAVTTQWATFLGANGANAYVSVGSNAVARYTFNGDDGALGDLTEVMSYPMAIRFDGSNAYAVLGYTGWSAL